MKFTVKVERYGNDMWKVIVKSGRTQMSSITGDSLDACLDRVPESLKQWAIKIK